MVKREKKIKAKDWNKAHGLQEWHLSYQGWEFGPGEGDPVYVILLLIISLCAQCTVSLNNTEISEFGAEKRLLQHVQGNSSLVLRKPHNPQRVSVKHFKGRLKDRKLYSIFYENLYGKRIWKTMDMCICITESPCCTAEINKTL